MMLDSQNTRITTITTTTTTTIIIVTPTTMSSSLLLFQCWMMILMLSLIILSPPTCVAWTGPSFSSSRLQRQKPQPRFRHQGQPLWDPSTIETTTTTTTTGTTLFHHRHHPRRMRVPLSPHSKYHDHDHHYHSIREEVVDTDDGVVIDRMGRRDFVQSTFKLATTAGMTTSLLLLYPSSAAVAASSSSSSLSSTPPWGQDDGLANSVGVTIRRSASNIPGYGPPDVYYPPLFLGTWRVTRWVELPGRPSDAIPLRLEYTCRFIVPPTTTSSGKDDNDNGTSSIVVADRGSNQAELEKALAMIKQGVGATTAGDNQQRKDDGTKMTTMSSTGAATSPFVRSVEWVPTNPNDVRIVMADGSMKDIKVTKRSTERTDNTVSSSEFQRVLTTTTTNNNNNNIPTISARRVVSKWKIIDSSTIEGLEIVYDMGGGDPLAPGGSSLSSSLLPGNGPSAVLSKSRLLLVRQ